MPAQTTGKVLRVGVFRGERCLEERLLRKRAPITIGQTLSNTFVVPASSMPKTHKLFDVDNAGNYVLRVTERMGGRISLGSAEVVDVTRLRSNPSAKAVKDGYEVTISDRSRGKITIGQTRILFQFVAPPSSSLGMLPSALGGGALTGFATFLGPAILIAMALSALAQIGPLFYVMLQDWPEPEGFQEVPDWYLEQDAEAVEEEEEEEKKEEEEEDEDAEGKKDEVAEDVEVKPQDAQPEKQQRVVREVAPEEKRMRKEQGKKIVGQVFGVEGGDTSLGASIAGDIIGNEAPISALEGLNAADIGGPGIGGGTGLGLGDVGSAAGEPGIKGVEGGSGKQLIGAGAKTQTDTTRKKVELKIQDDTKIPESVASGDKKGIEQVFKQKFKQVENCYKRVIQRHGDQRGKLVVKVTIGGDGKVLKVQVAVDDIGKGLAACVEAKIQRWKFPPVGKPTTVAKRWIFG